VRLSTDSGKVNKKHLSIFTGLQIPGILSNLFSILVVIKNNIKITTNSIIKIVLFCNLNIILGVLFRDPSGIIIIKYFYLIIKEYY